MQKSGITIFAIIPAKLFFLKGLFKISVIIPLVWIHSSCKKIVKFSLSYFFFFLQLLKFICPLFFFPLFCLQNTFVYKVIKVKFFFFCRNLKNVFVLLRRSLYIIIRILLIFFSSFFFTLQRNTYISFFNQFLNLTKT